jgi:phosphoribosylformylglycinamidine synthase
VTTTPAQQESLWARAEKAGIFLPWIGTTGGSTLALGGAKPLDVAHLRERHEGWFPRFMGTP